MGQYTDTLSRFIHYGCKIIPELHRQNDIIQIKQKLCHALPDAAVLPGQQDSKRAPLDPALHCYSLFAQLPDLDIKGTLSFILSLHELQGTLETYRRNKNITEETEIRSLFGCLSSAVDPSRSSNCSMLYSEKKLNESKKDVLLQPCLSDQCRLQLAVLPSYKQVTLKIKKYMQLYVDLQSYRHYPAEISIKCLTTWSSSYLLRYPTITTWEFCAAADSLLGMVAMYTAASIPGITNEEVLLLDEACFPWLSGLTSLLQASVQARAEYGMNKLNFTSFYHNLKECEERILFFYENTEKACMKLKGSSLYLHIIKAMTGLHLTNPEADFGMFRLACSNILKKSTSRTYANICRLLRIFRIV